MRPYIKARIQIGLFLAAIWGGAALLALLNLYVNPAKPQQPEYTQRVEMCRWYKYDSIGAKSDSGYFPVTILEKVK